MGGCVWKQHLMYLRLMIRDKPREGVGEVEGRRLETASVWEGRLEGGREGEREQSPCQR